MPSSIKRARELGDDFALIFVESQGHTIQEAETMAWDRKWMGTHAMWTTEAPFRTEGNGLPSFALLNNEGEIILSGNPLAMKKDIEEAIDAEIAKSKQAPEGTPKSLKKAWKSFAKGDYAKAVAAAQKVVDKGGEDSEDAQVVLDTFVERVEAKIGRVEWMLDNGFLVDAKDMLKTLGKSTKGLAAVAEQMAEEVGVEYGKAMAESIEPTSTHRSFQGALHAIADALSAHGFAARAEQTEESDADGAELQIVAEHCPFGDAVVEHPVICAVDRGIVKGMLAQMIGSPAGADTASSLAQGDDVCVTHVSL